MSLLSKQQIYSVLEDPRLDLAGTQPTEEMISRFQEFCSLLEKWNCKINLTSEKKSHLIFEKHVFDSLQYLRWLNSSHKILDIGSGAGFPGVPIKIIHPDLDLVLLESQRKRCNFLREAIRILKLERVQVTEGRAENFSINPTYFEQFDRVIFRGFSSLHTCLVVGMPFLKEGGRIILKKSPEEAPDSTDESLINGRIIDSKEVEGFDGHRSLMMVIEKCST